ncbi:hypothetical protein CEXT_797791 [Caerostris extrusa]|uniref:Uncharacterized protein n=1 Tax=Caerostris extrusa TaxID=172846 RepID=A0AAV4PWI9_CAEEX|nr:hypothetical protein CEXT_797791 [Caerostris extrusa]
MQFVIEKPVCDRHQHTASISMSEVFSLCSNFQWPPVTNISVPFTEGAISGKGAQTRAGAAPRSVPLPSGSAQKEYCADRLAPKI